MKSNRERKIFTEYKEEYNYNCLEIDKWIEILTKFKDEGWQKLQLGTDYVHEAIFLELSKNRQETDKEYNKRMKLLDKAEKRKIEIEKKRKVEIEEEQRALYEKLKKKFEK